MILGKHSGSEPGATVDCIAVAKQPLTAGIGLPSCGFCGWFIDHEPSSGAHEVAWKLPRLHGIRPILPIDAGGGAGAGV